MEGGYLEFEENTNGLDRFFLNTSANMDGVISWVIRWGHRLVSSSAPDKLDNASTRVGEIALRSLFVLGGILSFFLGAVTIIPFVAAILVGGSTIMRAVGFAMQKDGYTHIRGSAPEVALKNGQATVMTWNISGDNRSSYKQGVSHWSVRSDSIIQSIKDKNPDVLIFLDAFDVVEDLVAKLGDQYAHFFAHLGKNILGKTSGCVVVTKCAVSRFSHDDFFNQHDTGINRGFSFLEIKADPTDSQPALRIIGAQLTPNADFLKPDEEAQKERVDQMAQIVNMIAKEKIFLPTFFAGSLGVDLKSKEGLDLSSYLRHSYKKQEPTHLDLRKEWDPSIEAVDSSSEVVSLMKRLCPDGRELPIREQGIQFVDCEIIKSTKLTDYSGIATTVQGLEAVRK
jgi:hypothetical protein